MGPHVFGDGRLGLQIIDAGNLSGRLAAIKAFGGGWFTDVFLPRTAQVQHVDAVKGAGLTAGFVAAVDELTAAQYAARCLGDINRLFPGGGGALDANIEVADAAIAPFVSQFLGAFRAHRPNYRVRLNIAFRKAGFLPIARVQEDRHLYVCEQDYISPPGQQMAPTSSADAMLDMLEAGVPRDKAAICYGAAADYPPPVGRVRRFETGQLPRRGLVFSDDLMAEVGLL